MKWRLYAERFDTADMSGSPRVFQSFSPPKNKLVKAFRTWVIYYNTPSFSSLSLKIYSDLNSGLGQLLWTSQKTWIGAQISTAAYAAKELYFDFANPIYLRKNDTYQIALSAGSYTGNNNTHLAWVRGTPDPNNVIDIANTTAHIARMPFYLGVIDGLR